MQNRILIFLCLSIGVCFSYSCKQSKSKVYNDIDETVLLDTVYFDYSSTKRKIIFRGFINDTSEVKILFDTGFPMDEFVASDSLGNHLGDTSSIRLWYSKKKYKQSLSPRLYPDSSYIFQKLGLNTVTVGWQYFFDKVIQISYENEYMVITDDIENIPDIHTYDSIHFNIGEIFSHILIPIKLEIQGNTIENEAIIDTGADRAIIVKGSLLEEYSINFEDAFIGTSRSGGIGKRSKEIQLKANSISVKNCSIKDANISYCPFLKYFDSPILIGNLFWKEHSVILDLKNFVLYLK